MNLKFISLLALCEEGSAYDSGNEACVECPKNTFMNRPRQRLPCDSCPSGTITLTSGSKTEVDCKCKVFTQI